MSFMQFITHQHHRQPNRAIRQLYKGKLVHRVSQQPQQHTSTSRHCLLRKTQIAPDLPHPNTKIHPLKQKITSNASRSKYFMLKHNSSYSPNSPPPVDDHEMIMQHHDSFSSYLHKQKHTPTRTSRNFRYFDLDQIANQLASPKPLQNKLETQEEAIEKRKKQLIGLKNCQLFLENVEIEKDRYHLEGNTQHIRMKSSNFIGSKNKKYSLRCHSLLRQPTQPKGQQQLDPWHQNQQEHSPLPKRHTNTQTKRQTNTQAAYPSHLLP